jgi:hypothetical protein
MDNAAAGNRIKASSHYCERQCSSTYLPHQVHTAGRINLAKTFRGILGRLLRSILDAPLCGRLLYLLNLYLPFVGVLHRRHYSNNSLCIDITTVCNLKCFNCQASVRQAPANDIFSVEQAEKFVKEAIELRYFWDRISLFGGEPTLHPRFFDILDVLKRYKDFNPDCVIDVVTNATGGKVNSILAALPSWVSVECSKKEEGREIYPFGSYNLAPIDLPAYKFFCDFSKGCPIIAGCYGLGLSRYGYYPSSPCMHVDRVFGFDIGIKKLSQVNEKALRAQMKVLCRYCGWFKLYSGIICAEKISGSWRKAYAEYKKQKPRLSLYGA